MKVAIYIRVSTEEQAREGYSLAAQERSLREKCSREGWEVYDVYADRGISGKDITHRPAMTTMLDDASRHEFDLILVWALSRFTRSVADLYTTYENLQKWGVDFCSLTEAFDTSTTMGRAMMGIIGVFAQLERELASERVTAALEQRAKDAKCTFSECLGYERQGDYVAINPVEAERVRYIFDKFIEYKNLSAVAELCRLKGYTGKRGRQQTAYTVRVILTRPVYAGYYTFRENVYRGNFEPIISAKKYNKVQRILMNLNTGRKCKRKLRLLKEGQEDEEAERLVDQFGFTYEQLEEIEAETSKTVDMRR